MPSHGTVGKTTAVEACCRHQAWERVRITDRSSGRGFAAPLTSTVRRRSQRGRDGAIKHWCRQLEDVVRQVIRVHPTRRIVVAGPGMSKDAWIKGLRYQDVRNLIDATTYSTGYTDDHQGIREAVRADLGEAPPH